MRLSAIFAYLQLFKTRHNGIVRILNSYFFDMTNEEFASFGVPNCAVVRYDFPDIPRPEALKRFRKDA